MPRAEFEIKDFSAGYIDGIDTNLIPPNAAKWSENWLSRTLGKLEKRKGQTYKYPQHSSMGAIQGMHAYYYGLGLTNRRHVIAAGGQVGYWTLPTFNTIQTGLSTTAVALFETCVNFMVMFNGIDAPIKWDGTTASALLNAPLDGQFPTLFKEKLFVVPKSDPSNLQWSDSFEPEIWPVVNFWPVKDGDGDEITCLRVFIDELTIFKNHSIHSLRGTSLDDFRMDELDSRVGCVGPHAATVVGGNRLYFVARDGLYSFNGMVAKNLSNAAIPNLWRRINLAAIHKAAAGFYQDFVWFALPLDGSNTNNIVLAYLPGEPGTWWPLTGINATQFLSFDTGSTNDEFYSGTYDGYIVHHTEEVEDDFGDPVKATWQGFSMDHGRAENEKKAKRAYLRHSPADVDPPELLVSIDDGSYRPLTYERHHTMVSRYRFVQKRFRYLSVKFKHEGLGPCEVRGIYVPFKIKSKPKVRYAPSVKTSVFTGEAHLEALAPSVTIT